MTVKESLISSQEQQKPWVETPLKESYALSQAAGWYGHTPSLLCLCLHLSLLFVALSELPD